MKNINTNQLDNLPSPHAPDATEQIPLNPWASLYSLGFSLIPLAAGGKKPLVKWTEFQTAKPDWAQIEQWQLDYPDANIGIVTGTVSGIFVVDFDSPEAFQAAQHRGLGCGVIAKSGRGYHVYYRHPEWTVKTTTGILDHVDIRSDGGYIVAPPSVHENGTVYEWVDDPSGIATAYMSEWLSKLLGDAAGASPSGDAAQKVDNSWAIKALEDEAALVRSAPNGKRNDQLNASAFKMGQLAGANLIDADLAKATLIAAAMLNGLSAQEAQRTIKSGLAAGKTQPWILPNGSPQTTKTLSEDRFAREFTECHGENTRFCHTSGQWFVFNGNHWVSDHTKQVSNLIRVIIRELSAGAATFSKSSVVNGTENLAKNDRAHAVTTGFWDAHTYLLGTPKGTVDLKTGDLRPACPKDAITKVTACAPEDGSPATWLRFLNDATGNDPSMVRYLQQICGYALTGDTKEHALFFVHGHGGNGKSVFLNTVAGILADYATTASMETFTAQKFAQHSTELAMLVGARLVSASETEADRKLAEARIKQLTGGDPITARFMRQDNFTFQPQFKLMIIGNHEPRIQHVDDAIRRRFNVLPFTFKPQNPDKDLEKKLKSEWPQILNWIIEGCIDWQANGLIRPAKVTAATEEYFDDQDIFGQWLKTKCTINLKMDHFKVPVSTAFKSWSDFAEEMGEPAGDKQGLGRRLKKFGIESKPKSNFETGIKERYYIGMIINNHSM
jgi:putative DNA primase/helicase